MIKKGTELKCINNTFDYITFDKIYIAQNDSSQGVVNIINDNGTAVGIYDLSHFEVTEQDFKVGDVVEVTRVEFKGAYKYELGDRGIITKIRGSSIDVNIGTTGNKVIL